MTFRHSLGFALPVIALACLAGGAFAAEKAAAPPAASATKTAPAPVMPTITPAQVEPVISPAHLAAARAVIVGSGLSRSFKPVIPELMGQIDLTITRTRPELTADMNAVLTKLQPEFEAQSSEMVDNAAKIAAASIDTADLTKIAAFFNSPAGKKYVAAQPQMLQRLMVTTHAWTQRMSEHMMTRVREEMKKRGKQL